jgi:hypothetical protein
MSVCDHNLMTTCMFPMLVDRFWIRMSVCDHNLMTTCMIPIRVDRFWIRYVCMCS